ncbi:MAG: hypothetical protein BGO98_06950 [Myxococcales bacterium 68-20]|nr:MAG: hypothetical protein BGO98_06950 [Myxococcales bacterium 68-20]
MQRHRRNVTDATSDRFTDATASCGRRNGQRHRRNVTDATSDRFTDATASCGRRNGRRNNGRRNVGPIRCRIVQRHGRNVTDATDRFVAADAPGRPGTPRTQRRADS